MKPVGGLSVRTRGAHHYQCCTKIINGHLSPVTCTLRKVPTFFMSKYWYPNAWIIRYVFLVYSILYKLSLIT